MNKFIQDIERLPQLLAGEGPFYEVCVKLSDLRAIIEQHQQASVTLTRSHWVGRLCDQYEKDMRLCGCTPDISLSMVRSELPLYTSPQPDIVAELVKALEDDALAATFQSMAGYRTALIAKVKGVMG